MANASEYLDIITARIAAMHYERDFDVDDLLIKACARLRSVGLSIGGIIQSSLGKRGQCASSVHAIDLRNGANFDIWEKRGASSSGCRLDERGLVDAEYAVMTRFCAILSCDNRGPFQATWPP
jgi:hypothetical protein